jgi:hypothetical protein
MYHKESFGRSKENRRDKEIHRLFDDQISLHLSFLNKESRPTKIISEKEFCGLWTEFSILRGGADVVFSGTLKAMSYLIS